MAAVPVTITGVLFDKHARTTQLVTLMGEASITGLGIGGGPIIPPEPPPGTGIWPNPPEGQAPLPSHPIVLPGDPSWGDPHPAHPIVIPPPNIPTEPPPEGEKPPPENGGWGYWGDPVNAWVYKPGPGQASPK